MQAGIPQGSVISPALFNDFVSDCLIPYSDMTSYADHFTLMASTPSIVEAEARANQLCFSFGRWTDSKQLAIAPQKSNVTLFTSDTHFTFGPHACDCAERASKALNVMKDLAGSNLSFTTESLVATYKSIVRPILNHCSLHQVHSTV